MTSFSRGVAALAATVMTAVMLSACTTTLPWPDETGGASPSSAPPSTGQPSVAPSTKPKPSVDPSMIPLPPADAAFELYGPAEAWLDPDYVNGAHEPLSLRGTLCYVDRVENIAIVSEESGAVAYSADGTELWRLRDHRCGYTAMGEIAAPLLVTAAGDIVSAESTTGAVMPVFAPGDRSVQMIAADLPSQTYVFVVTSTLSADTVTLVAVRDAKPLWEQKSPFGTDTYFVCTVIAAGTVGCDDDGDVVVMSLSTGEVSHTARAPGRSIWWGMDWYSTYDKNYEVKAFDLTGEAIPELTDIWTPSPSSHVYVSAASLIGTPATGSFVEAITISGDSAALYTDGQVRTPAGVALAGTKSAYVRGVSTDGRVLQMWSDNSEVLVDSTGAVVVKLTDDDAFITNTNGVVTTQHDDFQGFDIWFAKKN